MKNRLSSSFRPPGKRRPLRPRVSLQRALSKLGLCSRAEAEEVIKGGRVTVNGNKVIDPAYRVDLGLQRIHAEGLAHRVSASQTIAFHKPPGIVTTRKDERGRHTVFDVLGSIANGLKAVGRLDIESSGLLLLTTDHRLLDNLTRPDALVEKEYEVVVEGNLDHATLEQLRHGVSISAGGRRYTTRPARVDIVRPSTLRMILTEGKNRQIRKMAQAVGLTVRRLHRVRVGNVSLGSLPEGSWRPVAAAEIPGMTSRKPSLR
ncbi:MAG: hypothetical protein A3H45_00410 [Ignavibacteria bacterium RIFCSPLOWO2_02_FULL_55_14]|nr:MAG: hypothetical protein A2X68_06080 [Ignavibacteria bacterium GWC2_56_12]OGU68901.1 MAG: hypothetical protein A3H45_00410 [Ignavibacteria bacterium RIFCSPLOWO2_02_FULL_55_14]OGU76294.1 MAG: hypothetical protein A3G43_11135 [Ignavibacteria bacterium RIFCSPLOWO2_12_FULL_56_21]